jgi:hypothetical protein
VSQDRSQKRRLFHRYCEPVGLAAGLGAVGFGFGAQKSGSAAMNSFDGLLIFGLTANIVLSLLMTISAGSLLYRTCGLPLRTAATTTHIALERKLRSAALSR